MANKLILRKQKSPYTGDFADTTKSKTLSISELDNNQIYLKGLNIITGSTSGTDIILDKLNGDQITIDASSLGGSSTLDYGNIIFVSEVGTSSGVTRNDIIGDITSPVSLELATQLAQSGDTIHVKSGTYNVQTTGFTGLSVDGVNHYFEEGANVYKSTTGNMFATSGGGPIFAEANVYGSGSFYGSGSCDYIYYNFGIISDTAKVFEWDICENTANKCYYSVFNGNTILKGKRRMYSPYDCIDSNPSDFYDLYVECPVIESLSGNCVSSSVGAGTMGNLTIKGDRFISSTPFNSVSNGTIQNPELLAIYAGNHADDSGIYIEANYITSLAIEAVVGIAVATVNATRVDVAWNKGTKLDINAHVGQFEQISGLSNVALCDMPRGAGTGKINVTVNGDFTPQASYQQQIPFSGDIEINLKQFVTQAPPSPIPDFGSGRALFSTSPVRFLGTWYLDGWWVAVSSGRIHIPTDTYINLGPKGFLAIGAPESARSTEVFNVATDIIFAGTIVEHCDYNLGPCPISDSGVTYSALPIFRNSGNTIINGATYVARDNHSQLVASTIAKDAKVYAGGLTTNKIGVFDPIAEKMRVTVTDSGATITVNGETFTTTTGSTVEECAAELVSLIGASGTVGVTPSQDNPSTDDNFYLTSDVIANSVLAVFDVNTELDILIDRLAIGVTNTTGGTVIEDVNVTDYIFDTINS